MLSVSYALAVPMMILMRFSHVRQPEDPCSHCSRLPLSTYSYTSILQYATVAYTSYSKCENIVGIPVPVYIGSVYYKSLNEMYLKVGGFFMSLVSVSYLWVPSMQYPRNRTRFLCRTRPMASTSTRNSLSAWPLP